MGEVKRQEQQAEPEAGGQERVEHHDLDRPSVTDMGAAARTRRGRVAAGVRRSRVARASIAASALAPSGTRRRVDSSGRSAGTNWMQISLAPSGVTELIATVQ
jgi:hypothetical protein